MRKFRLWLICGASGLPLLLLGLIVVRVAASTPPAPLGAWELNEPTGGVVTETTALHPVRDNTLYESGTGSLSNGQGQHLFAGRTATGFVRRGLLAFDVAGDLPPFATIVSATLELHMSRSVAAPALVHLHLLQAAWGEGNSNAVGQEGAGAPAAPGDATWLHAFYNMASWASPGGDYRAAPTASTLVDGLGFYSWYSAQLVADVQQWLADPTAAYGWILLGDESAAGTAYRFDSRENSLENLRPVLWITYTMPLLDNQLFLPLITQPGANLD